MQVPFYRVDSPRYATDRDEERRNPVRELIPFSLPGMNCPVCGTWATSLRLRKPLPADVLEQFAAYEFLTPDEWKSRLPVWASLLSVSPRELVPGMALGMPRGEVTGVVDDDVVHPFPGLLWLQPSLTYKLQTAGFSGAEFAQVDLTSATGAPVPLLHELVVLGRASRRGINESEYEPCSVCGRRRFPRPGYLVVDESRWDGTDFFFVDENPGIVFVTARVREWLSAQRPTNVEVSPL